MSVTTENETSTYLALIRRKVKFLTCVLAPENASFQKSTYYLPFLEMY